MAESVGHNTCTAGCCAVASGHAANARGELATPHALPSGRGAHPTTSFDGSVVHHSTIAPLMTGSGLGCAKTPAPAAHVETSRRNCAPWSRIVLRRKCADFVVKVFCPSECVRLIQDQASMRNVDSRIHSLRFDCCVFLFYSFSAVTFATQSAKLGHCRPRGLGPAISRNERLWNFARSLRLRA